MSGKHNVQNALAAIAVAADSRSRNKYDKKKFGNFRWFDRRFQVYEKVKISSLTLRLSMITVIILRK